MILYSHVLISLNGNTNSEIVIKIWASTLTFKYILHVFTRYRQVLFQLYLIIIIECIIYIGLPMSSFPWKISWASIIHCSKYLKEHCVFCHWPQYKCTHSPTHSKSWINKAKTCLSCDWFGNWSRVMFLDENEVIPFQKSPWNTWKYNFAKNTLFFRSKFKDDLFNQTTQHHHFCTFNGLLMAQ